MAFVTGLLLVDAPASALNNGEGGDIGSKVKQISVYDRKRNARDDYPYVSAQAFRYWLRGTVADLYPKMKASKVEFAGSGQRQQAYTQGDPIQYWDDDLLGYMRAIKDDKGKNITITRVSPFRTSTLVSVAPQNIQNDFGVMARGKKEEGSKDGAVLHSHEFYRTTLKGMFSLDLTSVGTFSNQKRPGFHNLSKEGIQIAEDSRFAYDEEASAFRMPDEERIARVQMLLRALARLEGGAKQTLHYTDVAPAFVIAAITRGGNHAFGRIIKADSRGEPVIHEAALDQALDVFAEDMLSPVFVGRAEGFMDSEHDKLAARDLRVMHPIQALDALADYLSEKPELMD